EGVPRSYPMKIRLLWPALVLPLLFGADDSGWKEFTSKEGGFTVSWPGKPTERTQAAGGSTMRMFLVEVSRDLAYTVVYSDKSDDATFALDPAWQQAMAKYKGKLVSEKKIKLGSYPGKEIRFDLPDSLLGVRMRLYAVKHRLYQVMLAAE